LTLGLPDGFIEHGPIPKLLELYGLSPAKIAAATYKKLNESPGNGLAAGGKLIKTLRKAIKTGMNGINGKDPARRASRR
jgi:hypothetical protein